MINSNGTFQKGFFYNGIYDGPNQKQSGVNIFNKKETPSVVIVDESFEPDSDAVRKAKEKLCK